LTAEGSKCGIAMCDKCVEIDGRIEHYRRLAAGILDQQTIEAIKRLIERLMMQKDELHPDQQQ
jgi:hypothetical protein